MHSGCKMRPLARLTRGRCFSGWTSWIVQATISAETCSNALSSAATKAGLPAPLTGAWALKMRVRTTVPLRSFSTFTEICTSAVGAPVTSTSKRRISITSW